MELLIFLWLAILIAGSITASMFYHKWGPFVEEEPPVKPPVRPKMPLSEQIVQEAERWLGKDASPLNLAPQELACAEAVSNVIHGVIPDFPQNIVGTDALAKILDSSPYFERVIEYAPGTIIISPRTATTYGHCGVFLSGDRIASNNSTTGLFEDNYSYANWIRVFKKGRGLHIYLWRARNNGK